MTVMTFQMIVGTSMRFRRANKKFRDKQSRAFNQSCIKPEPEEKMMIKTTMYFGRNINQSDGFLFEVTYMNWIGFLQQVVDKYYSGYTWWNATGVWNSKTEDAFVLEIVHEKAAEEAGKIADIACEYKKLYSQDSVMVTVQELSLVFV